MAKAKQETKCGAVEDVVRGDGAARSRKCIADPGHEGEHTWGLWTTWKEAAPPIPKTLAGKLAWITGQVGVVPKNGHNSFFNYDYVREADLVDAIRGLLAKANVMIIPNVDSVVEDERGKTSKGATIYLTRLKMLYEIVDGDDPEQRITVPWIGYGSDDSDKGIYKAYTGSQKYLLMKLFNVATGLEPEDDASRHEMEAQTPPRTRQERAGATPAVRAATGTAKPPAAAEQAAPPVAEPGSERKASDAQTRALQALAKRKKVDDPADRKAPNLHAIAGVASLKELTSEAASSLIAKLQADDFDLATEILAAAERSVGLGASMAVATAVDTLDPAEPEGDPPVEVAPDPNEGLSASERFERASRTTKPPIEEPPGMDDPATEEQWERAWALRGGAGPVRDILESKYGVTDTSLVTKRMLAEVIVG